MDQLEKQLNNLPQFRLRKKADLMIRARIRFALARKQLSGWQSGLDAFSMLRPAAVVAGLSLVLSLPVYAYASPSVTPGHPLYPVKRNLEEIEAITVDSQAEAAAFQAKLAERRLAEARILAAKGEEAGKLKTAIKEAQKNNEASRLAAISAATGTLAGLDSELSARRESQAEALAEVAQAVGIAEDEELTDTIAAALEEAKTPSVWPKIRRSFPAGLPQDRERTAGASTSPEAKPVEGGSEEERGADKDGKASALRAGQAPDTRTTGQQAASTPRPKNRMEARSRTSASSTAQELSQVQAKIEELKNQIGPEYEKEQVGRLFERLDRKIKEAGERLTEEDLESAEGLIQATEALTNNAKHFLRPKKTEKIRQGGGDKNGEVSGKERVDRDFNGALRDRGGNRGPKAD